MTDESDFKYDVFLSYSSHNQDVVRDIANRLKSDGVKVWFDEWIIQPDDSIPAKIEDGLEHSRVLVLCLSAEALSSDWTQLESHTFRFKDPLNHNRRFIPLRLDDTPTKGSLAQFSYIDWRAEECDQEYLKLLEACQAMATRPIEAEHANEPIALSTSKLDYNEVVKAYAFGADGKKAITGAGDSSIRLWHIESRHCLRTLEGHGGEVWAVASSADQSRVISGSGDATVRIWDVEAQRCLLVLEGHKKAIYGVAWSQDQSRILSASHDHTLRLWDADTGRCLRVLEDDTKNVNVVAWNPDGRHAVSGSLDNRVRLWDVDTGRCLCAFDGHTGNVWTVAWSADQQRVLSGSTDHTLRLWDVETQQCVRVLEGHTGNIGTVAWNANQRLAISGCYSGDNSVRLWDVEAGRCLRVLEGHSSGVVSVAWSADGRRAFSGDDKGGICVWDLSEFVAKPPVLKSPAATPTPLQDQVQYTNAKVLLVGNSAAGKTGLSNRLALDTYKETDSTVGAWATQWKLSLPEGDDTVARVSDPSSVNDKDGENPDSESQATVEREVWLWDFGGQADQRLIHQLYMDQTQVAALVFDPQKDDVFETLGQWDRDLSRADKDKADRDRMTKLLVAGRCDAGGLRVARKQVDDFVDERGYAGYLETSAKKNIGCAELKQAIIDGIKWENIPWRSSPVLFKRLKDAILQLKDENRVLMRFNELREVLSLRMSHREGEAPAEPLDGASDTRLGGSLALWFGHKYCILCVVKCDLRSVM